MKLSFPSFCWKKDFVERHKNGEVNIVSLNIFQRCFRKLGFYANTHLSEILTVAQEVFFSSKLDNWSGKNKKLLFSAINKAQSKKTLEKSTLLGKVNLDKENIFYYAQLHNKKCLFTVKVFDKATKKSRESHIEMGAIENEKGALKIYSLNEFKKENDDFKNKNDVLGHHTDLFFSKLIRDSKNLKILHYPKEIKLTKEGALGTDDSQKCPLEKLVTLDNLLNASF